MNLWIEPKVKTDLQARAAVEDLSANQVLRRLAKGYAKGVVALPSEEDLAAA